MAYALVLLLLFVSILAEGSVVSFPFVLITSLMYVSIDNSIRSLSIIFLSSLFLDGILLSAFGSHGLYIFITLFIMTLCKKSFDTASVWFLIIFGLLSSIFYIIIFSYPFHILLFISTIVIFIIFTINIISKKQRETQRIRLA